MAKVKELWSSSLTSDMVLDLDQDTIAELVEALNDAVMLTCQDYGL
jgi:hypothetical protein